ncbi:MAG: acyl-protein synthetase [Polyangiales bacterium]
MSAWPDDPVGAALRARIEALVDAARSLPDADFDALAVALFAWQRGRNAVLARVAEALGSGEAPRGADEVPAVPSDVFKVARVACFEARSEVRAFETSGTTRDARGRHPFADTSLYARACVEDAARWLLPAPRYRCVMLALSEDEAPTSSLTFMLARFAARWDPGASATFFVRDGALVVDGVVDAVREARAGGLPVALLGTTFAFIHLADHLDALGVTLPLPPDSVVMPTGGSKGRAREVPDDALRALLARVLDVRPSQVVGEYGMTELSSQAWEVAPGRYRAPPWLRVTTVDANTLQRKEIGEVGLIRCHDLLNLGSSAAILTADLGVVHDDGTFRVLGRASGATPRGCARAMDHLLLGTP